MNWRYSPTEKKIVNDQKEYQLPGWAVDFFEIRRMEFKNKFNTYPKICYLSIRNQELVLHAGKNMKLKFKGDIVDRLINMIKRYNSKPKQKQISEIDRNMRNAYLLTIIRNLKEILLDTMQKLEKLENKL